MKAKNHLPEAAAAYKGCRSKCRLIGYVVILCCCISVAFAQKLPVRHRFDPGEVINYELYFKWGLLMPRAGNATISIHESSFRGKDAFHYRLLFNTSGLFEKVYKMRDTLECFFTPDMLLLHSEKRVNENDYYLIDELSFSYHKEAVLARSHRYTPTRTKIDTTLVSQKQLMFDMLGATMYLRSIDWNNISIGDEFPCRIAIGRDRIPVSFRYAGQQIVERSDQRYKTRLFYIDIHDDAFTQSKAAGEIWVGDDENRIPVKIRAKLKIGAAEVYYKSSEGLRYPLSSQFKMSR